MKLPEISKRKAVIVCILLVLGAVGTYLAYSIGTQQRDSVAVDNQSANDTLFRCFIIEYNQSYTKDALVIHLTDADLEDHPEYKRAMEEADATTVEWRDGRRYIREVQQYSGEFWAFDLCLEEYSRAECLSHLKLYEYRGRYFEIRCIPTYIGPRPGS
ncbi:MAG: hypothetical protein QMC96_12705 [Methanomicrobiales archaeon]|nr:hypothetical protein [Methanomicrobiales archaeon]